MMTHKHMPTGREKTISNMPHEAKKTPVSLVVLKMPSKSPGQPQRSKFMARICDLLKPMARGVKPEVSRKPLINLEP